MAPGELSCVDAWPIGTRTVNTSPERMRSRTATDVNLESKLAHLAYWTFKIFASLKQVLCGPTRVGFHPGTSAFIPMGCTSGSNLDRFRCLLKSYTGQEFDRRLMVFGHSSSISLSDLESYLNALENCNSCASLMKVVVSEAI